MKTAESTVSEEEFSWSLGYNPTTSTGSTTTNFRSRFNNHRSRINAHLRLSSENKRNDDFLYQHFHSSGHLGLSHLTIRQSHGREGIAEEGGRVDV